MRPIEIIARKRDGHELTAGQIAILVDLFTRGALPDYQMSAFLMAVVLNGMTSAETAALSASMLESGAILDLSELGRPVVDKHSTGGIGDQTSLVVAPV